MTTERRPVGGIHGCILLLNELLFIQSGAYRAGKAGEGACNSYIDCIDIEIQTWLTFTTFSNIPNMALTGTFT